MSKCEIEEVGQVFILRAEVGVTTTMLSMVCDALPEKAVIDPNAARILGATMVIGMPDEIAELVESRRGAYTEGVERKAAGSGLSKEAVAWLAGDHRGLSSNALFACLMNYPEATDPDDADCHPHDPADFARCLRMLEAVPEARARLHRAAKMSPVWDRLIDNWYDLELIFKNEAPNWNAENPRWSAPKTYNLMKRVIDQKPAATAAA